MPPSRHTTLIACLSTVGIAIAADEEPLLPPCGPDIQAWKMEAAELSGHVPEGHVLVEYTIDLRGHAVDAKIIESSQQRFNEPWLKAMAAWRFAPPAQVCRRRTPITIRVQDAENAQQANRARSP
jgi:TonB family protein